MSFKTTSFRLFLLTCLVLSSFSAMTQQTWQKAYGTSHNDFPRQMIPLSEGGYLFTGQSPTSIPNIQTIAYLGRVGPNGDSVWTKQILPIDTNKSIVGYSLYEVNPNEYLLGCNGAMIKYDSSGNMIWNKKVPGSILKILDYNNDEVIFSTGRHLQRINLNGDLKWQVALPYFMGPKTVIKNHINNYCYLYCDTNSIYYREINSEGQEVKHQVLSSTNHFKISNIFYQDADSNYIEAYNVPTGMKAVKYGKSLNVIWEKPFSADFNLTNYIYDISQTSDKGYIVLGQDYNDPSGDISFIKLNKNGDKVFHHSLVRFLKQEVPTDIYVDNADNFIVFGQGEDGPIGGYDYLLVKTDSGGVLTSSFFEKNKTEPLKVYPNPVQDQLTIYIGNLSGHLEIYDLSGRCLITKEFKNENLYSLDVSLLDIGMYVLKIQSRVSNTTLYSKFFKQ